MNKINQYSLGSLMPPQIKQAQRKW